MTILKVCVKKPQCDISKTTKFLQRFIPEIIFRSEIGNEAAFIVPNTNLSIFPEMLFHLEKSMDDLDLEEYGLSISALDEVYIKVCADHAAENINFNLELINCNRFRLHTGIRKYFVQWKAMLYKKLLFTFQPPKLFIAQALIVLAFVCFACFRGDSLKRSPRPLNISLDLYNDARVMYRISNESKLKMQPLAFYMEEYFKKFQPKSTLAFTGNQSASSIVANTSGALDVKNIGALEFHNNENVSIFFNNLPLHSMPIMVLLWINLVTKFELGEDYNVEVVNHPIPFKRDYVKAIDTESRLYAMFVSVGLSIAFAFFNYNMTRGRVERQVLLQFLGGMRVSTLWLVNIVWDMMIIAIFVSLAVIVSLLFKIEITETKTNIIELYLALMFLGFGILVFAYINSFWSKDPSLSVACSALKDIILVMIIFPMILRVRRDQHSAATHGFMNFTNYLFNINPAYGTISVLFKLNRLRKTNNSCLSACEILHSRHPEFYINCTAAHLCGLKPPHKRSLCCCEFFFHKFKLKILTENPKLTGFISSN